jgi:hypothetical protein
VSFELSAVMPRLNFFIVIAGLDPAIHDEIRHTSKVLMDARVKPGHDE